MLDFVIHEYFGLRTRWSQNRNIQYSCSYDTLRCRTATCFGSRLHFQLMLDPWLSHTTPTVAALAACRCGASSAHAASRGGGEYGSGQKPVDWVFDQESRSSWKWWSQLALGNLDISNFGLWWLWTPTENPRLSEWGRTIIVELSRATDWCWNQMFRMCAAATRWLLWSFRSVCSSLSTTTGGAWIRWFAQKRKL